LTRIELLAKFLNDILICLAMVIWHRARKKKASGGLYRKHADKRKRELGRVPAHTKVSKKNKVNRIRTAGADHKMRAFQLQIANVYDPSTKKFHKAEIKKVMENKASRHFPRMGIITKGAIIETSAGKAKVTNRPGQEGMINAVLIS
jgi:small subunit ribosomal protein S8e